MDYSATFARHFARLVWLLTNDVGNVDEQKMSLRALVTVSRNGPVALLAHDLQLLANEQLIPGALTGVRDVAAQMAAHSMESIEIQAKSRPADILGLARILAADAVPGDGGVAFTRKLEALGATSIAVTTTIPPAPASEPAFEEPDTAPAAGGGSRLTEERPAQPTPASAPAATPARGAVRSDAPTLITPIGQQDVTKLTPEELFAALDASQESDAVARALDDLVTLAEHSVRVGRPAVVGAIFHEIVARDAAVTEPDLRKEYVLAIRRLSKPAVLRAVSSMIPRKPERRQHYYEVLARTGEDGADALIEQITQAPTANDRQTLMEVLMVLDDAVPALVRMLGDSRWFVARNAADLLGELAAAPAEQPLIGLLKHPDDRVRRSATNALMKLGTTDGLRAIYDAVNDSSPEVRMQVAAAIASRKDSRTSNTLIRAIDGEPDQDVQLAMVAALGRVATPDAVQKLARMAAPDARLFRKKETHLRVAAAQALGEARTPAAIAALRELLDDKERDVRETATRALAHASR